MVQRVPKHKGVYILPNLFTTGSLFCAFLGMVWALNGKYEYCALAIFLSGLMDGLDGKVARLTGTSSEFGIQYDSLCDLVAFGVTPAFMVYAMYLGQYNRLGLAISFLFAACCALRLARFNVTATAPSNKRFFTGLPAPAGGCTLAIWVLVQSNLPFFIQNNAAPITLVLTACVAFLMVSRMRYAAFKEFGFFKAHPFRNMVFAIVVFVLIVSHPKIVGFLMIFGYLLSGVIYTFIVLPRHNKKIARDSEEV